MDKELIGRMAYMAAFGATVRPADVEAAGKRECIASAYPELVPLAESTPYGLEDLYTRYLRNNKDIGELMQEIRGEQEDDRTPRNRAERRHGRRC